MVETITNKNHEIYSLHDWSGIVSIPPRESDFVFYFVELFIELRSLLSILSFSTAEQVQNLRVALLFIMAFYNDFLNKD